MAKSKANGVEPIRSVRDLAELVGRGKSTVDRWMKNPEWTFGRPPWPRRSVPDILHWAAEHIRERSDVQPIGIQPQASEPPPPVQPAPEGASPQPQTQTFAGTMADLKQRKLAAEVRRITAQANHAETALAKERGDLLDAADVEMQWAKVGASIRNGFENLASEIVGYSQTYGMPQTSAPAFHQQVDQAIGRILRVLSEGHDANDAEDDEDGDA